MTGIEKETQRGEMTKGRRNICPQRIVFWPACWKKTNKIQAKKTKIGSTEDCFCLVYCALPLEKMSSARPRDNDIAAIWSNFCESVALGSVKITTLLWIYDGTWLRNTKKISWKEVFVPRPYLQVSWTVQLTFWHYKHTELKLLTVLLCQTLFCIIELIQPPFCNSVA